MDRAMMILRYVIYAAGFWGGGALEVKLTMRLWVYALAMESREHLTIDAFVPMPWRSHPKTWPGMRSWTRPMLW